MGTRGERGPTEDFSSQAQPSGTKKEMSRPMNSLLTYVSTKAKNSSNGPGIRTKYKNASNMNLKIQLSNVNPSKLDQSDKPGQPKHPAKALC